jgi:hypothetical protein
MLRVFMLNVVVTSVIMLSVFMLNVVVMSVIMLSAIMLSVIMLSVIMLCVIMLSVVMPKVVAPPSTTSFFAAQTKSSKSIKQRKKRLSGSCVSADDEALPINSLDLLIYNSFLAKYFFLSDIGMMILAILSKTLLLSHFYAQCCSSFL